MSKKRSNSRIAPSVASVDRAAVYALLGEVALVSVLVLGVFLLLGLLSYRGLDADGLPVHGGWTGPAGTYLSFALYQIAGHASLLVPCTLVLGSVVSLATRSNAIRPLRVLGVVASIVMAAGLLHVGWVGEPVRGGHGAGGAAGTFLGDRMEAMFAGPGTFLLLTFGLCVALVLVSGLGPRAFTSVLASVLWQAGRRGGSLVVRGAVASGSLAGRLTSRAAPEARESKGAQLTTVPLIHRGEPDPDSDDEQPTVHRPAPRAGVSPGACVETEQDEYELPSIDFLEEPSPSEEEVTDEELHELAERLREILEHYGVRGTVEDIHTGPVVTTVELCPEVGTKLSMINRLSDDLRMRLEVTSVRIVAPIPGKNAVGFELPTPRRAKVFLSELIGHDEFSSDSHRLPLTIGKDIRGDAFVRDLHRMPHLLIAGTTGSGKSVAINTLLMSLLYKFTPDELKLILVDPKQVELQFYEGIPHLLLPVVKDMRHASSALKWAVDEMERRYQLFSDHDVRDIVSFNRKVDDLDEEWEEEEEDEDLEEEDEEEGDEEDEEDEQGAEPERLPYVIIVIDEFADLMLVSARDVEWSVQRLAAKARAAGIHLVVATQRPSANVVSGLIKSNFPCRMSFKVASKMDSRIMFDANGAESLLGAGDMLIKPPGTDELTRVHGAFVSVEEIRTVVDFLREQGEPSYREEILEAGQEDDLIDGLGDDVDEKYQDAIRIVVTERRASISYLQRRLGIGYNRSAKMFERMEVEGIVGPAVPGKGQREILLPPPAGD